MSYRAVEIFVMKWLREEMRLYGIVKHRINPKTMRWQRWQKHQAKVYREAAAKWRGWGIQAARCMAERLPSPIHENPLPLERLCHAAFDAGFADEKLRLELADRRRYRWGTCWNAVRTHSRYRASSSRQLM
jgi:hypothetical protein